MAKESIELALSILEAEKANLSPKQLSRLAVLAKVGEDTREGVTEILEVDEIAEDRELSLEQADQIVDRLKTRFELPENEKLRKTVNFADVEKSLRAAPEKLYGLFKLEETSGEPQVVGFDRNEFVFEDRSKESPLGRRNRDAYQTADEAEEWGVDVQTDEAYEAMQKEGEYDLQTGSWLRTSKAHMKKTGGAMGGYRYHGGVKVDGFNAKDSDPDCGWCASLRVKKV